MTPEVIERKIHDTLRRRIDCKETRCILETARGLNLKFSSRRGRQIFSINTKYFTHSTDKKKRPKQHTRCVWGVTGKLAIDGA
jgi:hypothetical protein